MEAEIHRKRIDHVVEWFHYLRENFSKSDSAFALGVQDYINSYWDVYSHHGTLASARAAALSNGMLDHEGRLLEGNQDRPAMTGGDLAQYHAGKQAMDAMVQSRVEAGHIAESDTPTDYDGAIWNLSVGTGTPYGRL